ncbi:MAG: ThuA domain-containing protein [Thermoguttaceae bacterium]
MKRNLLRVGIPLAILAGLLVISQSGNCQNLTGGKQPPQLSEGDLAKIEGALPGSAASSPKSRRRILIFWRCEGFFHGDGIAGGNEALRRMGEKTGAYTADSSDDYAVFEPANLARYDALVLNNTTGLKFPKPELKQALLDFVRGGKGLVGIHAAADNFYDWPEGAAMVGGLFDGHPWGGGGTWAFRLDDPEHVLNRAFGGKGFKLQDEIYQYREPYSRKDRRVLVTLDLSDPATGAVEKGVKRTDGDFAVAWIKTEGKGRVFYCGLGHGRNVFMEPAVLKFYLDGIQYALGDLEADASPK